MKRIAITRTEPGASELASALEEKGYQPLVVPFQSVAPSGEKCPIKHPDVWIFLSYHAVTHACSELWRNASRVLAIGEATSVALATFDVVAQVPSPHNSEGLHALVNKRHSDMKSICIVSGKAGRDVLHPWLEADNFEVFTWRVYERRDLPISTELFECDVVVVASVSAVNRLHDHRRRIGTQYMKPALMVPSERIEEYATELGFKEILRADSASPVAVVRALDERYQS